ncbi:hypothetical protein D3C84_1270280 [compost metagenome]
MTVAEVPLHIEQPLDSVVVMEQIGIEAAAVQHDGLGPRAVHIVRRYKIVVQILINAFTRFDVGVN